MGCDIHVCVERKVNGKWEQQYVFGTPREGDYEDYYNKYWYHARNYHLFALLAGVRNYINIIPLSELRGLPENVSEGINQELDYWGSEAHSISYFVLSELLKVKNASISLYFNIKNYEDFKEKEKIELFNFDYIDKYNPIYPNNNTLIVSNEEMDRILKMKSFLGDKDIITNIVREISVYEISSKFFKETLENISILDPNPNNLRVVFWFDN